MTETPSIPGAPAWKIAVVLTGLGGVVALALAWQLGFVPSSALSAPVSKGVPTGSPSGEGSSFPPGALAAMRIPEFRLTDQDEKPVTRDVFAGRYSILAFTFTHCPTACPIMHSHLIRLQEELRGTPVKIVSVSVDPAHDSPAVLKGHALRLGADPARWSFLTGDEEAVRAIVSGLGFALSKDASMPVALPDGATMSNIVHPTKLILVGPDVTVIGMETGLEWSGAEAISSQARGWVARRMPTR